MPDINLFTPGRIDGFETRNRMIMAPMTRSRANAGAVPSEMAIESYTQRAAAGLINTEGTAPAAAGARLRQDTFDSHSGSDIRMEENHRGGSRQRRTHFSAAHACGAHRTFHQSNHGKNLCLPRRIRRSSRQSHRWDWPIFTCCERRRFQTSLKSCGHCTGGAFTLDSGNAMLSAGGADFIVFGKLFTSNPDLPVRFQKGLPLADPDPTTFYSPGPKGYIDFPDVS